MCLLIKEISSEIKALDNKKHLPPRRCFFFSPEAG